MNQFLNITTSDFKLIFRDPTLRIFFALPLIIYALTLFFLPYLVGRYEGFGQYLPYILVVVAIENTQMFSFIYSMVLIEEKETMVAKIYGVLPVSKTGFVLSRLVAPTVITVLLNFILLLLQPFYALPVLACLLFSIVAALIVPAYILGVAVLCKNKMEGMVWVKVFNILVIIPVVAFFIPDTFARLFGIFPTYWAFQGLNNIIEGNMYSLFLLVGMLYLVGLLFVGLRKFAVNHFV